MKTPSPRHSTSFRPVATLTGKGTAQFADRRADAPRLITQMQTIRSAATAPVVQRNCFQDFSSYSQAKNATIYSKALLDEQKDDPIKQHFQKNFDNNQQYKIYDVNKKHYSRNEIISDSDGTTPLVKADSDTVPHIDHRFPKSQGGTNSFNNAAVLSASKNMAKSNKLVIGKEPDKPLAPYVNLKDNNYNIGFAKGFSANQRQDILNANTNYYGQGCPVSDEDGTTKLGKYDTTQIPHVDHIKAKSEGGSNYYFNAMVLPASENIEKSGKKGQRLDLDYEAAELSLPKFYKVQKSNFKNSVIVNNNEDE